MKNIFLPALLLIISVLISASSGCTKIDIPIKKEEEKLIKIKSDKSIILDTEPTIITLENADEPIKWSINSVYNGGYFVPPDGVKVLFSPPDIDKTCDIELEAIDSNGNKASITIKVIDEGPPPTPGDILINEIAWAGTIKSAYDEYIEILNTTERDFYLNNWVVENAGGNNISIIFSGYIKAKSTFLITNYETLSIKSSITVKSDFVTSKLALSNSRFGPYILEDSQANIYDVVGDGKSYIYGINSNDIKSSMARFVFEGEPTINWTPESWYTEGASINLSDNTFGTPGVINSNIVYGVDPDEKDAGGIIIKYFVDANDETGDDWAQILITKPGDIKNFVLTDLDGSDHSVTNNESVLLNEGEIITIIWGDSYSNINNQFTIPDTNPTGTKDELVLLSSGIFLDGLCYYSTDEVQFDDEEKIKGYGWKGNPIHSKYGERKSINNSYITDLSADSWYIEKKPLP